MRSLNNNNNIIFLNNNNNIIKRIKMKEEINVELWGGG